MLKALRDRDAQQAWDATGDVLPPLPVVRPVADPVLSPPGLPSVIASDVVAAQPDWKQSRAAEGRKALKPYPEPMARTAQGQASDPFGSTGESGAESGPGGGTAGEAQGAGEDVSPDTGVERPIARTPAQLRSIRDIQPFFDYEPDKDIADPCLNLCPRPDGLPCKQYAAGEIVPACPEEVGLGDEPFTPRSIPPSVFSWTASNINYYPLYFQDPQLERYGHTYGWAQPAVSLGRFGVQLVGLPYQMALDPPCKRMYPLGYYRPGEPAPKLFYPIPFNARAAAVAGGFYTGLAFILP
jgi:hypothetical protein